MPRSFHPRDKSSRNISTINLNRNLIFFRLIMKFIIKNFLEISKSLNTSKKKKKMDTPYFASLETMFAQTMHIFATNCFWKHDAQPER